MDEGDLVTERPGDRRRFIALLVALAVLVVFVVANYVHERHEDDLQVDQLYCTLSGITPFDRAPKTGRLCADIALNG